MQSFYPRFCPVAVAVACLANYRMTRCLDSFTINAVGQDDFSDVKVPEVAKVPKVGDGKTKQSQ